MESDTTFLTAAIPPVSSRKSSRSPSALLRNQYPPSPSPARSSPNVGVPAPAPPEVISSLIASLSAISAPNSSDLPDATAIPARKSSMPSNPRRRTLTVAPSTSYTYKPSPARSIAELDEFEEDEWHDPAQQGGRSRSRDSRFSMAPSLRSLASEMLESQTNGAKLVRRSVIVDISESGIQRRSDATSIGLPSVMNLQNNSTASLPSSLHSGRLKSSPQSGSIRSESKQSNHSLRRFLRPVKPKKVSQDRTDEGLQESSQSRLATILRPKAEKDRSSRPTSRNSSIAPTVLSSHMIPSRRSSLRHSFSGLPRPQDFDRPSSSRDIRDMDISPDLIDEDYSAVKRIRELQQAKEDRQNEWRAQSRRSDRSSRSKRNSLPSAPTSHHPRRPGSHKSSLSRHSIADVLTEEKFGPDLADAAPSVLQQTTGTPRSAAPLTSTSGNAARPRIPVFVKDDSSMPADLLREPSSREQQNQERTNGQLSPALGWDNGGSIDEQVEAFVAAPRLNQKVRHPQTGRIITFSEVGDPNGFAVVCCVGMGLTRYLTAFYDELARALKLRLITPDRPGIGDSQPYRRGHATPLNWADDVTAICNQLGVTKFSLLAHSAGAIYALAVALRLPQQIRGRIHLLAPWIPPSQLATANTSSKGSPTLAAVPFSQKVLGILPTSFLKAANSGFMSPNSASVTYKSPKPSGKSSRKDIYTTVSDPPSINSINNAVARAHSHHLSADGAMDRSSPSGSPRVGQAPSSSPSPTHSRDLDNAMTSRIWDLATANANPAVDLLVCLERRFPIGFRYVDVTRALVLHHGSRDTRVPVENVRWLAGQMRRAELRELPGEGHGLMASAAVMSAILAEVSREWEDWARVVRAKEREKAAKAARAAAAAAAGVGEREKQELVEDDDDNDDDDDDDDAVEVDGFGWVNKEPRGT